MFSLRRFYNNHAAKIGFWALAVPQITLGQNGPAITKSAVSFGIAPQWIAIAKIGVRFLLVGTITVAAIIAFVGLHNWMYNEGNAIKTFENKERLGKMMAVITVCFVLLALYRLWVPDYHLLSL